MTNKADITLPPLPEARIVSYQTDSTMRSMELRTYSDEDMRDYARAAVQANSLSADDLADIDDALANLIQDKRDYCPHEDGTAEHVARLEALRQRLTHGGNCAAVEADRQDHVRDATKMMPSDGRILPEEAPTDMVQNLRSAIEGECDGLYVTEIQARMILAFLLTEHPDLGRYGQPAASAEPVADAATTLAAICDLFGIGSAARDPGTILTNVENVVRRSECLRAVERHLTVSTPPDLDEGDDEPGEECLLRWGADHEGYAEQFKDALKKFGYTLAAPVAQKPVATTGRTHSLKTDPEVFQAVFEGRKTFEIRVNDRGFRVGDELLLKETTRTGAEIKDGAPLEYTGRTCRRAVSHILTGYGLAENWCCLSFAAPIAAQAQPCDHVYEARPIDGTTRASAQCEPVCRKCGYRPAARAAKEQP